MAANEFPDGIAPDAAGFLPNPPAPEALLPPLTHDDLSWIADNSTRAPGIQPITAANPDGDVPGIPLSTRPVRD